MTSRRALGVLAAGVAEVERSSSASESSSSESVSYVCACSSRSAARMSVPSSGRVKNSCATYCSANFMSRAVIVRRPHACVNRSAVPTARDMRARTAEVTMRIVSTLTCGASLDASAVDPVRMKPKSPMCAVWCARRYT